MASRNEEVLTLNIEVKGEQAKDMLGAIDKTLQNMSDSMESGADASRSWSETLGESFKNAGELGQTFGDSARSGIETVINGLQGLTSRMLDFLPLPDKLRSAFEETLDGVITALEPVIMAFEQTAKTLGSLIGIVNEARMALLDTVAGIPYIGFVFDGINHAIDLLIKSLAVLIPTLGTLGASIQATFLVKAAAVPAILGAITTVASGLATTMGRSLENAFVKVTSVLAGTTDELKRFERQIVEISRQVPETAHQVSDAMRVVVKAGIRGEETIETVTQGLLKLGRVEMVNADMIADDVIQVTEAFQLLDEQSEETFDDFINNLSVVATNTRATMDQIIKSMARMAAQAELIDIPASQVAALAGTIQQAGQEAARGGTRLRRGFQSIVAALTDAEDMQILADILDLDYEQMAMRVERDMAGVILDLSKTVSESETQMRDYGELLDLTGEAGATAFAAISARADLLQDLMVEMEEDTESLSRRNEEMMDTFGKQMQMLFNRVRVMAGDLGYAFLEPITDMIRGFNESLERVEKRYDEFVGYIRENSRDIFANIFELLGLDRFEDEGFSGVFEGMRKGIEQLGGPIFSVFYNSAMIAFEALISFATPVTIQFVKNIFEVLKGLLSPVFKEANNIVRNYILVPIEKAIRYIFGDLIWQTSADFGHYFGRVLREGFMWSWAWFERDMNDAMSDMHSSARELREQMGDWIPIEEGSYRAGDQYYELLDILNEALTVSEKIEDGILEPEAIFDNVEQADELVSRLTEIETYAGYIKGDESIDLVKGAPHIRKSIKELGELIDEMGGIPEDMEDAYRQQAEEIRKEVESYDLFVEAIIPELDADWEEAISGLDEQVTESIMDSIEKGLEEIDIDADRLEKIQESGRDALEQIMEEEGVDLFVDLVTGSAEAAEKLGEALELTTSQVDELIKELDLIEGRVSRAEERFREAFDISEMPETVEDILSHYDHLFEDDLPIFMEEELEELISELRDTELGARLEAWHGQIENYNELQAKIFEEHHEMNEHFEDSSSLLSRTLDPMVLITENSSEMKRNLKDIGLGFRELATLDIYKDEGVLDPEFIETIGDLTAQQAISLIENQERIENLAQEAREKYKEGPGTLEELIEEMVGETFNIPEIAEYMSSEIFKAAQEIGNTLENEMVDGLHRIFELGSQALPGEGRRIGEEIMESVRDDMKRQMAGVVVDDIMPDDLDIMLSQVMGGMMANVGDDLGDIESFFDTLNMGPFQDFLLQLNRLSDMDEEELKFDHIEELFSLLEEEDTTYAAENIGDFLEDVFSEGFKQMQESAGAMFTDSIFDWIEDSEVTWEDAFRDFARNLGRMFAETFIERATQEFIMDPIFDAISEIDWGDGGGWGSLFGNSESANDALITNDGRVIHFHPNDNILAFQDGNLGVGGEIHTSSPKDYSGSKETKIEIHNYSSEEVEVEEEEEGDVDVKHIIIGTVSENIGRGGELDKTMKRTYGLNRKGH